MRTIVFILLCLTLMIACEEKADKQKEMVEEQQPVTEDPELQTFRDNTETVKALIAAFEAEDTTRLATYISDDFIWSPPSVGMDSLPRKEFMNTMQSYMDAYDDISLTDAQYYAGLDEDQSPNGDVRVYGLWESKHADSGKDAKLKWYSVYFFNEQGKIVHQAEWFDTADLEKEF